MIRVLIVDDELLVRVGLKTFVPWEQLGYEVVGEASNGEEALALLGEQSCDLLLTDIQMPVMNGLQLIERVRALYPRMTCLILSNYDEFRYVRTALQLGAVDYVLKLTIEPQELVDKLTEFRERLLEVRSMRSREETLRLEAESLRRETREKRFRDILTKSCSAAEIRDCLQAYGYGEEDGPYSIACLQIRRYEQVLADNRYKSEILLVYSVSNILSELLKAGGGELIELSGGRFALLFKGEPPGARLAEMADCVLRYLRLQLAIGYSLPCAGERRLHEAYLQALSALDACFYGTSDEAVAYGDMPLGAGDPPALQAEQWRKDIKTGDAATLCDAVAAWADEWRAGRRWTSDQVKDGWIGLLHLFATAPDQNIGDIYALPQHDGKYPLHAIRSAETLSEIVGWMIGWIPRYMQFAQERSPVRWRTEIRRVAQRIAESFDTPLKVSELAREVGFNEAYLSALYRKETGETIMEHMIRLRMEKARILLADPDLKIYEVSEAIGYSDANYFAKLFKKIEGMHPQEFRQRRFNR